MSQDLVLGQIVDFGERGDVMIRAAVPSLDRAVTRKYSKVLIAFQDGRRLSPEQRAKAYALIKEIADWVGDAPAETKETMKLEFRIHRMEGMARKAFSLSDVDMNTAADFITYLIDFIVENDIPTSEPLYKFAEDINKYVYACIMNRKCCICGKEAELHHCEGSRVGMGSNRTEVHHLGRWVFPLCRQHHTEIHYAPERKFWERYHINPIKADKSICRKYRLKE